MELERRGRAFFLEAARKTESVLARQTFEFLAAEEDRHIERIEEFYRSLEETGEENLPDTEPSTASDRLASFNETLARLKDRVSPSITDREAYQTALAFENGAEDLYMTKAREATNPKVRKFYEWLIEEESMHSRLLDSCLEFVDDPVTWFNKHGSSNP